MPSPRRTRAIRNLQSAATQATKFTGNVASKATVSTFKWATTDHSGMGDAMKRMPKSGFLDTISFILAQLFYVLFRAAVLGILIFLLVGYGIPLLIRIIF